MKKFIAFATALALTAASVDSLQADECSYVGGCGYQECCASPCLTPAIALGAIAIVAIVAVALQNTHGHHNHHHSH